MKFAVLAAISLVALSDNPVNVADEYRALSDEYLTAVRQSDAAYKKAGTDEERRKIHADFQKLHSGFVGRYLAFAEKHPGQKQALLALFFVLHLDTRAEPRHLDRAVALVLKDHIKSDRLTDPPILQLLDDSPAAEKLLRGVLEKSPHHAIQAQACLSLARFIKDRANARPPEQAARLTREAEELFARIVNRYAGVKEAAEQAKYELFEIRHLAVGKTLPDIKGKGSDDREFKLSDYRGKVVVLTFWAQWCPPCMKMVPHERSLVKRLEGKPFALVGVNRDSSRESLRQCEAKNQITWRSFFDGPDGPISKGHNVKTMPTVFVLDATGVIRYKGVRGEAMDRAVDRLLAELDEGAKPGKQ